MKTLAPKVKRVAGWFGRLNWAHKIIVGCVAATVIIQCYNIYLMARISRLRAEIHTRAVGPATPTSPSQAKEEIYAEVRADEIGKAGELMMWAIRSGGGKWKRAGIREHPTDPNLRLVMRYNE